MRPCPASGVSSVHCALLWFSSRSAQCRCCSVASALTSGLIWPSCSGELDVASCVRELMTTPRAPALLTYRFPPLKLCSPKNSRLSCCCCSRSFLRRCCMSSPGCSLSWIRIRARSAPLENRGSGLLRLSTAELGGKLRMLPSAARPAAPQPCHAICGSAASGAVGHVQRDSSRRRVLRRRRAGRGCRGRGRRLLQERSSAGSFAGACPLSAGRGSARVISRCNCASCASSA